MQLLKRFGLIFLALALVICSGCGAGEGAEESIAESTAAQTQAPTETEQTMEAFPTAADYYSYLQSDVLSAYALATTEAVEIALDSGKNFNDCLENQAETGIVGAELHDYDGDGSLEMIVLLLTNESLADTYYANAYDGAADYYASHGNRAFVLNVLYYDAKDGAISCLSSNQMMVLPTDGWGTIAIGMEKVGDTYYLFGHIYSENMSTYGPNHTLVAVLGGETGFAYGYSSEMDFLGWNQAETNSGMGIDEPVQIQYLSLYDVLSDYSTLDEESFSASVGERAICYVNIDYVRYGEDEVEETVTDYTSLRQYLETGGQDWQERTLPEGYQREVSDATEDMAAFVEAIDAAAGTTFAANGVDVLDDTDGIYYAKFECGTLSLTLYWDVENGRPSDIRLSESSSDPYGGAWQAAKDAMLQSQVFGFTEAEIAPLLGQVGWTDYTAGIAVGDYTCMIYWVMDAGIWLYYTE